MYAVTERGVVGLQADSSIFWLQRLQSSYWPDRQSSPCPGDSEAAGLSRSEMSSAWQRRHRHTVNSQVRRRQSMQALVDRHRQFVAEIIDLESIQYK